MKLCGVHVVNRILQARFIRMNEALKRLSRKLFGLSDTDSRSQSSDDTDANTLPISHKNNHRASTGPEIFTSRRLSMTSEPPQSPRSYKSFTSLPDVEGPAIPSSPGKELWQRAFRTVKLHTAISSPHGMASVIGGAPEPLRRRTNSTNLTYKFDERRRTITEEPVKVVSRSRIALLQPKLKEIEPTQDLAAHSALVRHLQFSPDGKFLATSR